MKKLYTVVIVICTVINIYTFLPTLMAYVTETYSLSWVAKSGQLGDTFGGLLSPIIGSISIYFLYKTFKSQQRQIKDQREINTVQRGQIQEQNKQYHINRITDLIYLQLERVDESIKSQLFKVDVCGEEKITQGYNGIIAINGIVERDLIMRGIEEPYTTYKKVEKIIGNNISSLAEIYEKISAMSVIVRDLLDSSSLEFEQKKQLKKLLFLNLGETVKENIDHLRVFMNLYQENNEDLDSIWFFDNQVSKLRQFANLTYSFFDEFLSQLENKT